MLINVAFDEEAKRRDRERKRERERERNRQKEDGKDKTEAHSLDLMSSGLGVDTTAKGGV